MNVTEKGQDNPRKLNLLRFLVIGVLLLICIGTEYYFHFVLGIHIVYTHLFYIPIFLAAIFWGLKGGLPVSLFLALLHIVPHLSSIEIPVISRGFAFVFIGFVIGVVSSGRKRAEKRLKKRGEELKDAYEELKQTQARLIQAGKMAAMVSMAAGIAHQLNQPLAGIRGYAQVVLAEMSEENPLYKDLKKIEEQTGYMRDIINNVRGFSHQSELRKEPININEPIEKASGLLSEQLRLHGIKLVKNFDSNLPKVNADFNQMQQVFVNFINNAREAMDEMSKDAKKELTITTRLGSQKSEVGSQKVKGKKRTTEQDFVEVLFADTGPGIPEELKDRIFEPFFTTKGPRNTGLGLSLNYGIIEDHGGSIGISDGKKSVVFKVILPACEA